MSLHGVNPLRDPQDRRLPRIAGPSSLVIFGVTGDLSRKKLMPAVYDLANRGLLPPGFSLVGFARRDWAHEDFAQVVHDAVKEHSRTPFREEVWDQLAEGFRFVPGDFDDDDAFDTLRETIEELDEVRAGVRVRLADPPGALECREAAHEVRHERGRLAAAGEGRRDPLGSGDHRVRGSAHPSSPAARSLASTSARSLSPRPDRQTRSSVESVGSSRT